MPLVKITRNYQLTIPKAIREELKLREGDIVEVYREGDRIVIKKLERIDEIKDFLPKDFDKILKKMRTDSISRLKRLGVL
jgi:AbrB family looped-hinge helix DNA binding protein